MTTHRDFTSFARAGAFAAAPAVAPELPHSVDAEERLLSCLMIDGPEVVAGCLAADIEPSSFFVPANGTIFAAIVALAGRGEQVHAATVLEELRARGQLEASGGIPYLTQISGRVVTSVEAAFFVEKVSDYAKQRRLIAGLAAAHETARQPGTYAEVWEAVAPHLQSAQDAGARHGRRSLADAAALAKEWRLSPAKRPVLLTPWAGWDRAAGGLRGGELVVVAGRPGTGKTTLAGNIAHDASTTGKHTAFFSLEMGTEELVDRFAVRRAGRAGVGNDRHANATVAAQIDEVAKLRTLHVYEASDAPGIAQIEATCRLFAASPSGLAAVVVDYLQLVQPPADAKREVREQQVAAMSRRFKLLARALDCPILLLCQLNRESEKEERRPRLSDLRESGSIEQDADRVWFLYRPKPVPSQPPPPEDASEIDVALYQCKCRNGPAGIEAVLRFNRPDTIAACEAAETECACSRRRGLRPVKGAYPHGCGSDSNNQKGEQAHENG